MLLLLLLLLLLRVRPVSPRRASVSINDLRLRYGELAVGVGRAALLGPLLPELAPHLG